MLGGVGTPAHQVESVLAWRLRQKADWVHGGPDGWVKEGCSSEPGGWILAEVSPDGRCDRQSQWSLHASFPSSIKWGHSPAGTWRCLC